MASLEIEDCETAALQLMTLIKGELHTHMMCGLRPTPADCDADAHVSASVDFFLRAYAPRPTA